MPVYADETWCFYMKPRRRLSCATRRNLLGADFDLNIRSFTQSIYSFIHSFFLRSHLDDKVLQLIICISLFIYFRAPSDPVCY